MRVTLPLFIGVFMSAWPGKYVIGLTGNIATGKSVVRKMLEHLGAYGIDADALSHRAISTGWFGGADGKRRGSALCR